MGFMWVTGTGAIVSISFIIATLFMAGTGLRIEELRVPDPIKNGSESSVILDCDYSLLETDDPRELVVKWYFNDNPNPVYQWIPNQNPQGLGILKGKVNLHYLASEDEYKKHRAIQITNPTPDLSGDYKCTVSTFFNETSQTKKMIIYVPEKSLEVTQTKLKDDTAVNVTCSAEGVFPEPSLAIQREESTLDVQPLMMKKDGVYDIVASILLDDDHLHSPTTFHCELTIPEANYTVKTSSIYYPGHATTTTEEPSITSTEDGKDTVIFIMTRDTEDGSSLQTAATGLILLSLILCLRL